MIINGTDLDTQAHSLDEIRNRDWLKGIDLTTQQETRLDVLAKHGEAWDLRTALAMIKRSMVVAAVNGVTEAERVFLAEAWLQYGNLSAYDPDMLPDVAGDLQDRGVSAATCTVVKGSLTGFGDHVADIDVLVPAPGPWVDGNPLPPDLASCLDSVLGVNSNAYVFTDNEAAQNYAKTLQQRINAINSENEGALGYRPMQVTVTPVSGNSSFVKLGGASFKINHQPEYRLTKVTRN